MDPEERAVLSPCAEDDPLLRIEEMEARVETQAAEAEFLGEALCVWFVCTNVCPPGG